MRAFALVLVMGCSDPGATAPLPDDLAPPPGALVVSRLVPGHLAWAETSGLNPGATAWLVRGPSVGAGPCLPALQGACLGVRQPALLATTTADAAGLARWSFTVPAFAPVGAPLALQGAVVGATTPPVTTTLRSDPLAALSDELDNPATLGAWELLSDHEGPVLHDELAITGGQLRLSPNAYDNPILMDGGAGPGWFQDRKGPLLYREIDGDFAVRIQATATTTAGGTPSGPFHAAGLVIRDPSSYDPARIPDVGDERWIMYNIGMQDGALATELKTTFPDSSDADLESQSSLFLDPRGTNEAELVACRVGDVLRFWHRLPGQSAWTAEDPRAATMYHNGAGLIGPDYLASGFDRPDFGPVLQVGLMVGGWAPGTGQVVGTFDHVRFGTPSGLGDCLSAAVGGPG